VVQTPEPPKQELIDDASEKLKLEMKKVLIEEEIKEQVKSLFIEDLDEPNDLEISKNPKQVKSIFNSSFFKLDKPDILNQKTISLDPVSTQL
jgi:hypothetical protein